MMTIYTDLKLKKLDNSWTKEFFRVSMYKLPQVMVPGLPVPNIGVGVGIGLVGPVGSPEMVAGTVAGLLCNPRIFKHNLETILLRQER